MATKEITISDPGQSLRPLHKQTKLTRKKRIEFLNLMGKEFNITKQAAAIGSHRKSIEYLLKNDPQFKEAFLDVKNAWIYEMRGKGLKVAIRASHKSTQERRNFLQAYDPEFRPKQQIDVIHTFDLENWQPELRRIIDNAPKRIDADYRVLETKKLDKDRETEKPG